MKQCLDIEQMQHLQELGMDTSNASAEYYRMSKKMDWFLVFGCRSKEELQDTEESIPAYTLHDVLDALPKEIRYENKRCWLLIDLVDEKIEYYNENAVDKYHSVHSEFYTSSSLIDAAYELLVWCIEQGYIETNKNE